MKTIVISILLALPLAGLAQTRGSIQLDKTTFNIGETIRYTYTIKNTGQLIDTINIGSSNINSCFIIGLLGSSSQQSSCGIPTDGGTSSLILLPDSSRTFRGTIFPTPTVVGRYFIVARLNYSSLSLLSDTVQITIQATSSLSQESPASLQFRLGQNYPNPFNPNTIIPYQLDRAGEVLLEVYNVAGKWIATLAQGRQSAGRYEVNFNAQEFASGAYYYKLTVFGNIQTRKMLFVK